MLAVFRKPNAKLSFKTSVSSVVTTMLLVREVWGSNPGLVESDEVLPPLRHFSGAVLARC